MDESDYEVEAAAAQRLELKKTLYHECAHAVFMWNFGIEVERVMIDREGLTGHVMPLASWSEGYGTDRRIAHILVGFAGGVAHRCFQVGAEKGKLLCSSGDMRNILNLIAMFDVSSKAVGIYVFRGFLGRAIEIVEIPEVQSQIRALVKELRPRSCLLKRQVHVILKSLPASRIAMKKCREIIVEMDAKLPAFLAKAAEEAPQLVKQPFYLELSEIYELIKVTRFTET